MNIKLSIKHDSSQIPVVAKVVCHLCLLTEAGPSKNMELALVELLNNIIRNSGPAGPDSLIEIHCKFYGGNFLVTVTDGGDALSPGVAHEYGNKKINMPTVDTSALALSDLPESGWGIQLIKSVCEEVSYDRISDKNVYELKFDLSSAAA